MSEIMIPQELVEQMQRNNVILFAGAGISMGEGGLPSGHQLAQELAQRGDLGEVTCMSLPEVAQRYELKRGHQSLIEYISRTIDEPQYAPLRTHELIAALSFNKIITTNWDNLLEQAIRGRGKGLVQVVRDSDIGFLDEPKVGLIKLHGSIGQKDSIIVTGDDYYDMFARLPDVATLVQSYFATKTILFLGYGLGDEDFKRLYYEVVRHIGRHKRRAYAVQLHPDDFAIKYWERKSVEVIAADATDFLETLGGALEIQ